MNTETEIQTRKGVINENYMNGRWKLTHNVKGSMGAEGFGGYQLGPFVDPVSKKTVVLLNEQDNPRPLGYWVDKLITYFMPDKDTNRKDYNEVKFLLGHPEVGVEGVRIDERYSKTKVANPPCILVNLDYEKEEERNKQEIIDKLIGQLSLEGGPKAISLKKLQYILARINKPFIEAKYHNNESALKRALRSRVKDYVRDSLDNASEVTSVLDNIEEAKRIYVIKVLIDKGILVFKSGSIRFEGQPIGHNIDAASDYLHLNSEVYVTLQDILEKEIAKE